jgi:hypothetical protein
LPVAAIIALSMLGFAASVGAEGEFANPSTIEGVVTKSGGARLGGVEICAKDLSEESQPAECVESHSNGVYEILGLEEGTYRVEFKSGSSGLNLATQFWKNASSAGKATLIHASEDENPDIDATMQVVPVTSGVTVGGVLEPDVDGDGYGDATQDACPQSAAFHTACPTVTFAPAYSVGPTSIKVKVRTSAKTPVAVTGRLLGGGGTPKVVQSAAAGKVATFSLPIPDGLEARLARLDSSHSLSLRLRAHAVKINGAPSTDHLLVRLPGRGWATPSSAAAQTRRRSEPQSQF